MQVRDDGLGDEAPPAAKGAGTALDNIRARLRHRYGERASLHLLHGAGTDATIELPYQAKPCSLRPTVP